MTSSALASCSSEEKLDALTDASGFADGFLRARYTLPIVATVGRVKTTRVTGSTGTATVTAAASATPPTTAAGMVLTVVNSTTGKVSTDGGITYGSNFTLQAGDVVTGAGVTLTLSSGTWYAADSFSVRVHYNELTRCVCALAIEQLLRGRGVAPDGTGQGAYEFTRDAAKDARQWLKNVRDNMVDPGFADATATEEGSFFFDPDPPGTGNRAWNSVLGRDSSADIAEPSDA